MKVDRSIIVLKKTNDDDVCFVSGTPEELLSLVWEISAELWSLSGSEDAERTCQRNITKLIES